MKLADYDSVFFIGIGGIGMSALARWFKVQNYHVAGYDKTQTRLTSQLSEEGIIITYNDDIQSVDSSCFDQKTLVVYTPAIPKDSVIFNHYLSSGLTMLKRSQVLGLITQDHTTIAIAGTHGKTTTSSLVAHLLKQCDIPVTAFVGGITHNYKSNLMLDTSGKEAVIVVEADEYDRSFLTLSPDIAIVTTIDPDHLDIYGDQLEFVNTFRAFVNKIKPNGYLYINSAITEKLVDDKQVINVATYGATAAAITAHNYRIENDQYVFDYDNGKVRIDAIPFLLPGIHNLNNCIAAISAVLAVGASPQKIKEAVASFKGVKRRFDVLFKNDQLVYVDDYAHHPIELEALIQAVKHRYTDKKICMLFQPHLFSRTADFMDGFAEALSKVDKLLLMDIYPAREKPIEGITSQALLSKITCSDKKICQQNEVLSEIEKFEEGVFLTVGAGDIDRMIEPIVQHLTVKYVQ